MTKFEQSLEKLVDDCKAELTGLGRQRADELEDQLIRNAKYYMKPEDIRNNHIPSIECVARLEWLGDYNCLLVVEQMISRLADKFKTVETELWNIELNCADYLTGEIIFIICLNNRANPSTGAQVGVIFHVDPSWKNWDLRRVNLNNDIANSFDYLLDYSLTQNSWDYDGSPDIEVKGNTVQCNKIRWDAENLSAKEIFDGLSTIAQLVA